MFGSLFVLICVVVVGLCVVFFRMGGFCVCVGLASCI